MPVCSYCGSPIEPGQKFCTNCGAEITFNIPSETEQIPPQPASAFQEVEQRPAYEEPTSQPPVYQGSSYPAAPEPISYDGRTIVAAVFSFIFPIIGLILYFKWRNTNPRAAALCVRVAGIAIVMGVFLRMFS